MHKRKAVRIRIPASELLKQKQFRGSLFCRKPSWKLLMQLHFCVRPEGSDTSAALSCKAITKLFSPSLARAKCQDYCPY